MNHTLNSAPGTRPIQETRPTIGVSVEEFARMIGVSKRSAWTIIKQEAQAAKREGRKNQLTLRAPIIGGKTRRLRIADIESWFESLSKASS